MKLFAEVEYRFIPRLVTPGNSWSSLQEMIIFQKFDNWQEKEKEEEEEEEKKKKDDLLTC